MAIVVLRMLPWSAWEAVFGELSMDFSTWIVAGLMIVVGTVWTIVYNAAPLLAATARVAGRSRALAPILRLSMAYPLSARFRPRDRRAPPADRDPAGDRVPARHDRGGAAARVLVRGADRDRRGSGLGLLLARNIIRDSQSQPSWDNLTLVVPWGSLAIIFVTVYAVALLATLAPAVRASHIRPAEALRYQ